ncbi:transposase [Streptomyces sp. DT9]
MTDAQWARIDPLLPDRSPKRGGRWRDHRQVIHAIAAGLAGTGPGPGSATSRPVLTR